MCAIKERRGEHPYGDAGQLLLLVIFAAVWVSDSFFLNMTTFLSSYVSGYVRDIVLVVLVIVAVSLFLSSRVVIRGERPSEMVTDRASDTRDTRSIWVRSLATSPQRFPLFLSHP